MDSGSISRLSGGTERLRLPRARQLEWLSGKHEEVTSDITLSAQLKCLKN